MDDQSQQTQQARFSLFRPRKRVRAREVSSDEMARQTEAAAANGSPPPPVTAHLTDPTDAATDTTLGETPTAPASGPAAPLAPATPEMILEDVPPPVAPYGNPGPATPELVLDPTLLGERRRKHAHSHLYRSTFAAVVLSFGLSIASFILLMVEESEIGRWLAIGAAVLGVLAFRLARWSKLSARLHGYAVAAFVLAVLAFGVDTLPALFADETTPTRAHPAAPPAR